MKWYTNAAGAPDWLHTEALLAFHRSPQHYEDFVGGPTSGRFAVDRTWAIDLAVARSDDAELAALPQLDRTLTTLLRISDGVPPNNPAEREALARALRRLERYPQIQSLIDAVLANTKASANESFRTGLRQAS